MTRKALGRASGVSERYLADLEQGTGNASLLVLRQIADALAVGVEDLVHDGTETAAPVRRLRVWLDGLAPADVLRAERLLAEHFPAAASDRHNRLALIGLRGAGKSTVGAAAALALGRPFITLARAVEERAGRSIADLIASEGQAGFRRFERETLSELLTSHPHAVIDAGGGLVTEPSTFRLLRANCLVVWLKATPATHMQRVIAQGDTRPMEDAPEAMSDLEAILESRGHLYALADAAVDTTDLSVADTVGRIVALLRT
jgi:XRE family aerobic/anaerobic benzoate catabolism transcriptional regulator